MATLPRNGPAIARPFHGSRACRPDDFPPYPEPPRRPGSGLTEDLIGFGYRNAHRPPLDIGELTGPEIPIIRR